MHHGKLWKILTIYNEIKRHSLLQLKRGKKGNYKTISTSKEIREQQNEWQTSISYTQDRKQITKFKTVSHHRHHRYLLIP